MFCPAPCVGVREESVLTWTWAFRSGVASLRLVRAWRRSRGTTRRSSCRVRVRVGRQRPSRRKPARCMRPWSLPCSSLCTSAPRTSPQSPSDHHTHICPLPHTDPSSCIYTPTVPQARAMRSGRSGSGARPARRSDVGKGSICSRSHGLDSGLLYQDMYL